MEWPDSSPDLSPIENAWKYLKTRVQEAQSTSVETMKQTLKKEWISLDSQYCRALVESMPSRLQHVLEDKGGMTEC